MLSVWLRRYAEKDGRGYPDWAMRYAPIVRRLRRERKVAGRIVEIGANANGFARFAHVPVIAVDLNAANLREARATQPVLCVVADADALPFATESVDLFICIDTLEHVPPGARGHVLLDMLRVLASDGTGVVAFPSGTAAARAEREIGESYRRFCGRTIPWLDQHAGHGLPEADTIRDRLVEWAGAERRIALERNTPVCVWRWMWHILLCGWPGRGNALFQALLRVATPLLTHCRTRRGYRAVLWIGSPKRME